MLSGNQKCTTLLIPVISIYDWASIDCFDCQSLTQTQDVNQHSLSTFSAAGVKPIINISTVFRFTNKYGVQRLTETMHSVYMHSGTPTHCIAISIYKEDCNAGSTVTL